jgi:hypothetical protein
MNITKNTIINSNPLLLLYPAGTGGEHIAHTLSKCNSEFEGLVSYYNTSNNQHSTPCIINYATNISDVTNIDAWYNVHYLRSHTEYTGLRFILKDHPVQYAVDFYHEYFPDIQVVMMTPFTEHKYFASLSFKKLARKITTPIDEDFLFKDVSEDLTDTEKYSIISETNRFDWVWLHEIHIMVTNMRHNEGRVIVHYDDLQQAIQGHELHMHRMFNVMAQKVKDTFKNFHLINCDCLTHDSTMFWKDMQLIESSIDIDNAIAITNNWIARNNELLIRETINGQ